ncbi:YpzG family protein [bacterium LRH843]|nr:YpzG family protein [bacterium LRH843]
MGKEKNNFDYTDPFDSPRANPKRASTQVNGETQMTQNDIKLRVAARQRRK